MITLLITILITTNELRIVTHNNNSNNNNSNPNRNDNTDNNDTILMIRIMIE